MYVMFKGKGCENCPFVSISLTGNEYVGDLDCNLSEITLSDGTTLPKIEANASYKPKECPFPNSLQSVEVEAECNE